MTFSLPGNDMHAKLAKLFRTCCYYRSHVTVLVSFIVQKMGLPSKEDRLSIERTVQEI